MALFSNLLLGRNLGSQLVDLGQAGHISADAHLGIGRWRASAAELWQMGWRAVLDTHSTPQFTRRTTTVLKRFISGIESLSLIQFGAVSQ
jgi:predicted alpha/beta hydrolase family esterase